jgi:hypothetical protein
LFEDSAHAAQLGLTALDGELFGRFSAEKPTLAILTDHALSAGYLLASAARQIIIPEHGRAGSIGVVTLHADLSAALEQRGTKVTVLRAGTQKMSANPFEPLAGDTIQRLLADLEASRNTFAEPKRRTIAGVRPSLSDLRMRAAMRLKRLTASSKRSTP